MFKWVIFVLLLALACAMIDRAAWIHFTRSARCLTPTERRAALGGGASSALLFAVGLTLEAVGLRDEDPLLGFIGSLVVIGAIALGYTTRRSVSRND